MWYFKFYSTVVEHSTHNPESEGSHPVTHSGIEKWRYKCYISNTYLPYSIGTLISRVLFRSDQFILGVIGFQMNS